MTYPDRPARADIALKLLTLALVVFAFWIYYPALSLPPSLIDDYVKIHNLDRLIADYRAGGISQVIQNDISVVNRTYNLGFYLITAAEYRLSGNQPFHWLKLIELAAVCALLAAIIKRTVPLSRLGALAGLIAVFLFVTGDVPGGIDLHGLRASWYRLFATDVDGLAFVAVHVYCLVRMIQESESRKSWGWLLGAVGAGFVATTIKIPYIGLLTVPLVCVATASAVLHLRNTAIKTGSVAAALTFGFLVFYLAMRAVAAKAQTTGAYGSNVSLNPADLVSGLGFYVKSHFDVFGPLLPAVAAMVIIVFRHLWSERISQQLPLLVLLYFTVFTACAVAIYTPWTHRLWRYMLAGHFGVCALAGITSYFALHLMQISRPGWAGIIVIFVSAASALLLPLYLSVLFTLAVSVAYVFTMRTQLVYAIAGPAIVGIIYMLAIAPLQRSALHNFYLGREFANWQTTLKSLQLSAEGTTIHFAGDLVDEHMGSMMGHISHMGVTPRFEPLPENGELTSPSVVLVHRHLSAPEVAQKWAEQPLLTEFNVPTTSFKVPVNFWTFQKRLLGQQEHEALLYDTWQSDFLWRFHSGVPART